MEPDASTASAATSTSASSTTTPTHALKSPLPWLSISPLHQTQPCYPPKFMFTFPTPGIQKPIPESSKSRRNPSKKLSKPAVNSSLTFMPTAEPPFHIREPIPEFSMSQPEPSRKYVIPVVSSIPEFSMSQSEPSRKHVIPVVSSGRGFTPMAELPFCIREPIPEFSMSHRIREPEFFMSQSEPSRKHVIPVVSSIPEFSMSQSEPSRKHVIPVVFSGRGFMPMAEPPFRIREPIPEFSMSQPDTSRKHVIPVVPSGRGFMPTAEPPFRIREPTPEFSMSQPGPSTKLIKSVVSSGRGLMTMGPPAPRIRESRPEFSTFQKDPPQKISRPVVSSGRGFMHNCTGSVSTDQIAPLANLGPHAAEPVVQSPRDVRPPPLDYLRPSVQKRSSPTSLHQFQHHSSPESPRLSSDDGVSPSAIPKIVPPSSSPESSDSQEKGERINVETFAVVRDRKVLITEGASLYRLCRSWLRNGLPEEDYQVDIFLPHEMDRITLPKPLPRESAGATRSEEKEDSQDETRNENEGKEESFDHLTTKDLLKELINRGKRVRARLREERLRRLSRYKHRFSLILAKMKDQSDGDKT